MAVSPPFNISETVPDANDQVSAYPAAEQLFRDTVESWLSTHSDPATGLLLPAGMPDPLLSSTDGGAAAAPSLNMLRASPTPADGDIGPDINLKMHSDTAVIRTMARILVRADDVSNATEDSSLIFQNMIGGTLGTVYAIVGSQHVFTGSMTLSGAATFSSTLAVTSTFTANTVTATGAVQGSNLIMSNGILAMSSAASIFFRPNGVASASGQAILATSGNMSFNGNITSVADGFHTNNKSAANPATQGASILTSGQGDFTTDSDTCIIVNRIGSDGTVLQVRNDNSTVGSISFAGATTAFNTSSDMRLKYDWAPLDAGSVLDRTAVYQFNWKKTGTVGYGVLSQEAAKVLPEANSYDEKADLWMTDYSKYVPHLIAEVKALRKRMAQVEGENNAE